MSTAAASTASSPSAARARAPRASRTVVENRQARHQYHIEDTWEAGVELEGWEVKAALGGQATFNGGAAFVRIEQGQAFVENMTFTPMATGSAAPWGASEQDPNRRRRLLLRRTELDKLAKKVQERGYTVVPLELTYNGRLKLSLGLAKGKQLHDKKEALKTRDAEREMQREVQQRARKSVR